MDYFIANSGSYTRGGGGDQIPSWSYFTFSKNQNSIEIEIKERKKSCI